MPSINSSLKASFSQNSPAVVPPDKAIPTAIRRWSFRLLQSPDSGRNAFKPVFGAPHQVIKVHNAIAAEIRVQTVTCFQPAKGKQ